MRSARMLPHLSVLKTLREDISKLAASAEDNELVMSESTRIFSYYIIYPCFSKNPVVQHVLRRVLRYIGDELSISLLVH